MKLSRLFAILACSSFVFGLVLQGLQGQHLFAQGPPVRRHSTTQKRDLRLIDADRQTKYKNEVSIKDMQFSRVIQVNGIPEHKVGAFPNRGNPHAIKSKRSIYRVTLTPKRNTKTTPLGMGSFGIGLNGILFDPGAAEFWLGNRSSSWRYEPLGGAVPLGLDANYGHVQPDGKYHYHGLPTGLLQTLKLDKTKHSPLVGWAADGHPIYAVYGYDDFRNSKSKIKKLRSSYQLKQGDRPGTTGRNRLFPGGKYDGTFVNDYEFIEGHGDLDECNGRFTVTPEFPKGTYAYFLTENWPVIPRAFRGTPNPTFQKQGGPGRGQSRPRGSGRRGGRG